MGLRCKRPWIILEKAWRKDAQTPEGETEFQRKDQLRKVLNYLSMSIPLFDLGGNGLLLHFLHANGINAFPYHAGMATEERERIQNEFLAGEMDCVVATIAFGMGIDRLTMLLTGRETLREVILFPHLRSK